MIIGWNQPELFVITIIVNNIDVELLEVDGIITVILKLESWTLHMMAQILSSSRSSHPIPSQSKF